LATHVSFSMEYAVTVLYM